MEKKPDGNYTRMLQAVLNDNDDDMYMDLALNNLQRLYAMKPNLRKK